MANTILHKRSSASNTVPTTSNLSVGEIAINYRNNKLFIRSFDDEIVQFCPLNDGDKGDITVSSNGQTFTIDNTAVTYAKIQNVSATDRILGRSSAGAAACRRRAACWCATAPCATSRCRPSRRCSPERGAASRLTGQRRCVPYRGVPMRCDQRAARAASHASKRSASRASSGQLASASSA